MAAGDGVAHQLIADPAHDDGDGALAEAADEAEDRRGEDAGQRQGQGDVDRRSVPDVAPSTQLAWTAC